MNTTTNKVKWGQVITYYIIACAVSWPFFWWRDILHWQGFKGPGLLKTAAIMWGPGIAAIVCLLLFKKTHVSTISLLGTSKLRSLICWFVPFVLLAIFGVKDESGNYSHTFPLLISVVGAFTVLGEEVGWRGFLQDALRPMKPVWRYALIGILWEAWHFTNRTHGKEPLHAITIVAIFCVITILLSWLLGTAVERSRSILVAASMHGWVDLSFELGGISTYVCASLAILLWIFVLYKWPQDQAPLLAEQGMPS